MCLREMSSRLSASYISMLQNNIDAIISTRCVTVQKRKLTRIEPGVRSLVLARRSPPWTTLLYSVIECQGAYGLSAI